MPRYSSCRSSPPALAPTLPGSWDPLPPPAADEVGIVLPSLKLDSQAKYGARPGPRRTLRPAVVCRAVRASCRPSGAGRTLSRGFVPVPIAAFAGALSRGDAGIFMRFPDLVYREKIWDHAAGVIILQVGRPSATGSADVSPGSPRQAGGQAGRQAGTRAGRQARGQAGRQAGRQAVDCSCTAASPLVPTSISCATGGGRCGHRHHLGPPLALPTTHAALS